MAIKDGNRIFVGGLAYETTDRALESAFGRFGEIIEAQVIKERDTGRPRGFGFITYTDPDSVHTAISEMNNVELDGRIISVNRAETRDSDSFSTHSRSTGARSGGYRDEGPRGPPRDRDECYKCGRSGHWARDCPSMNGSGGGGRGSSRYSPPPPRYSSGGSRGRGSRGGNSGGGRFGGADRYGSGDYYVDDRYDGGRYERERIDPRDRYVPERYAPPPTHGGERYVVDRYGAERYPVDRYVQNGYSKERGYEREPVRGGAGPGGYYRDAPRGYERDPPPPRLGSGPTRYEGGGYRGRPGPYDRPSRGGRSYEDRY